MNIYTQYLVRSVKTNNSHVLLPYPLFQENSILCPHSKKTVFFYLKGLFFRMEIFANSNLTLKAKSFTGHIILWLELRNCNMQSMPWDFGSFTHKRMNKFCLALHKKFMYMNLWLFSCYLQKFMLTKFEIWKIWNLSFAKI